MNIHCKFKVGPSCRAVPVLTLREIANDRIPSVKPVVDNHDRLWDETKVLDEVDDMAADPKLSGSLFRAGHAEAMANLQAAQLDLAQAMAERDATQNVAQYRTLWQYVGAFWLSFFFFFFLSGI